MSRKGENIYKRKDGRWEGRYIKARTVEGKAIFGYIYGKKYAEVRQMLQVQRAAIPTSSCCVQSYQFSFASLLTQWANTKRLQIKESSYARYTQLINNNLIPYLGSIDLSDISPSIIESYINDLLCTGRKDGSGGLSSKTVADIIAIIRASLEFASNRGYRLNCSLPKKIIRVNREPISVLSLFEQKRLTAHLLSGTDYTKFGILLSLYTGIRIGEICALKWKSVIISDGILCVRETMQRIRNNDQSTGHKTKIVVTKPKSIKSVRDIPLPSFTCNIAKQFQRDPECYVLSGEKEAYIEPRVLQNRFKKTLLDSGINYTNFHTLRHTFATRCIEAGFEIKTLSEILGHSSVTITLDLYVHSSPDLKKDNMRKMVDYLFS